MHLIHISQDCINKRRELTGNAIVDISGGLSLWESIEEPPELLPGLLNRLHPLLHLEIAEVLLANPALLADADDTFPGEGPSDLAERGAGALVGGHVEVDAPVGVVLGGDDAAELGPGELGLGQALFRERDFVVRGRGVGGVVQIALGFGVPH